MPAQVADSVGGGSSSVAAAEVTQLAFYRHLFCTHGPGYELGSPSSFFTVTYEPGRSWHSHHLWLHIDMLGVGSIYHGKKIRDLKTFVERFDTPMVQGVHVPQ